jgi:hypothetical protein
MYQRFLHSYFSVLKSGVYPTFMSEESFWPQNMLIGHLIPKPRSFRYKYKSDRKPCIFAHQGKFVDRILAGKGQRKLSQGLSIVSLAGKVRSKRAAKIIRIRLKLRRILSALQVLQITDIYLDFCFDGNVCKSHISHKMVIFSSSQTHPMLEQTTYSGASVIMADISNDAVQGHRLINNNNHTPVTSRKAKTKRRESRFRANMGPAAYNIYQTKTLVT